MNVKKTMRLTNEFVIYILSFVILLGYTEGLRCYVCSFSSVDTDKSCETISNDTQTIECSVTYCTIFRQEYIDPAGEIASFMRGCEQSPDFLNHEIIDPTFRTFYRACTSELCNIGNGKDLLTGGNLSPTPPRLGTNLLVPGTGFAVTTSLHSSVLILCALLGALQYF